MPREARMDCPRCGYELRGEVERWVDSCPVDGVCPECGLEMRWGSVLDPNQRLFKWHVEHAKGWWRIGVAAALTFLRTFLPWRFWRLLRMEHPVRWRRMPIYLAAMLVVGHLSVAGVAGFEVAEGTMFRWTGASSWPKALGAGAATSRDMLLLRHRSGRGYFDWVARHTRPVWQNAARTTWAHMWRVPEKAVARIPVTLVLTIVICPLSFLILPYTLRRARVRRTHLARIGILSGPIVPLLLVPAWLLAGLAVNAGYAYAVSSTAICALGWAFLLMWWGAACQRYLHLPTPWFVANVMVVLSTLIAMALLQGLDLVLTVLT